MSTSLQPDFRERATTNDVPVARLIGLKQKTFVTAGHRHVVSWTSACEFDGNASRRNSLRHS